jgi:hypothetical protein
MTAPETKPRPAVPWANDPHGPALYAAAVRGNRLAWGPALVFADWLDDHDLDQPAAALRALARAELVAVEEAFEGAPPPPAGPYGLSAAWSRGIHAKVWVSLRTLQPWLPGLVDGKGVPSRKLWADANYAGVGTRRTPPRRLPGRVWLALHWSYPLNRLGGRHPYDDRCVYLDVPHKPPDAALAALAYEALAAVLAARLVGRDGAPEEPVIARA